jgi:hypothetical protein
MNDELKKRPGLPDIRYRPDGKWHDIWVDLKIKSHSFRDLRASLVGLIYLLARDLDSRGLIVLVESRISQEQLATELKLAGQSINPDVINRVTIAAKKSGEYRGLPNGLDDDFRTWLDELINKHRTSGRGSAGHSYYFIFQILLNSLFAGQKPLTISELRERCGCSYPTVSKALRQLNPYLLRTSDRRVGLRQIPKSELASFIAVSQDLRTSTRFIDRSGRPRSAVSHLDRLEKMAISDLAIGGVLGASHYLPGLDIVGVPRLDLSLHTLRKSPDLSFMRQLDPALEATADPSKAATVVVHMVRSAIPSFEPRDEGLLWADRVECLLDLYEARLEVQADEFLKALRSMSPNLQRQ